MSDVAAAAAGQGNALRPRSASAELLGRDGRRGVWSSADAEQLSLRSPDLTLRRLRAPLSEATPQVRRYAAGAMRRVGDAEGDAGRAATWGRVGAKAP